MRLLEEGIVLTDRLSKRPRKKQTRTNLCYLLSLQDDRRRANNETAAKEGDLEERRKDIEALTDKVDATSVEETP